ncbi:hypothetical protein AB4Y42_43390 [Paraburkholderia sp. EG286B]|uniref:hypothetical protein n=1 Tax=Paraburkholderia sp. EG286B TaxID=3237011 RepID=UPI0034D2C996
MALNRNDNPYWSGSEGEYHKYQQRLRRRVSVLIDGQEALTKKQMRECIDYAKTFQRSVIEDLRSSRRRAFRSGICLHLHVETSSNQPGPIQSLAKNFLDLLGKATHLDNTRRPRGVLYGDDQQVKMLSVSCSHGVDIPQFRKVAAPVRDVIADLVYAADLEKTHDDLFEGDFHADYRFADSLETVRKQTANPPAEDDSDMVKLDRLLAEIVDRQFAQEHLLGTGQLRLTELADLYRLNPSEGGDAWDELMRSSRKTSESWMLQAPFRIALPPLPTHDGSKAFRASVQGTFKEFGTSFRWLMLPLKVPVGIEVVVKPPHGANKAELFDLDNVVRTYLMDSIDRELSPPSDYLHAANLDYEVDSADATAMMLQEMRDRRDALPKAVRTGVVRYEVFRLPEADASSPDGYVTVNLTHGLNNPDFFRRIDRVVDKVATRHDW